MFQDINDALLISAIKKRFQLDPFASMANPTNLPKDWVSEFEETRREWVYFNRFFPDGKMSRINISTTYDCLDWQTSCAELHFATWRSWDGQLYPFCKPCAKFFDCNHLGGKRHASKLHMWEAKNSICSPIVANKKPKVEKGKLTSHDILAWFEEAEGAESLWVLTNLDRTKFEEVFERG